MVVVVALLVLRLMIWEWVEFVSLKLVCGFCCGVLDARFVVCRGLWLLRFGMLSW